MNKKATEYGTAALVIVTIIVFIAAGLMLYNKISNTLPLGQLQYKLLNTYDNAEKILFYVDSSAKQASYDALNDLADNAGIDNRIDCGKYFGSPLLVSLDKNCLPEDDNMNDNFLYYFQSSLLSYLSNFNYYNLNSQYGLWIDTDHSLVKGIAQNKVVLPIGDVKIEEAKPQEEYFPTTGNFFSSPSPSNKITSCFGYREAGSGASTNHEGFDFSTLKGKDVYSVADGKVVYSDKEAIEKNPEGCDCWGRVLIFHSNGLYTTFMHLDSITVKAGDVIKKGDKIGIAGARYPGKRINGAVHLHFEVISDKIKSLMVDPVTNAPISYEYNYRGTPGGNFAINPACFFDLSQFEIDYSSKACSQIDAAHVPTNKEDAVKKFCDIYTQKGVTLPEKEVTTTQNITSAKNATILAEKIVSLSSGAVTCSNADLNKLPNTDLKGCYRYYDIFQKYIKQYNLDVDPLLIMSIVSTESSCMNADELRSKGSSTADGGIMQVDEVCLRQKKCPDVDTQIKEGMKIFLQKFNDVENYGKDLKIEDKIILVLYSYNRGDVKGIIGYYKTGQYTLNQAILKGCMDNYKTSLPKGSADSRYDSKGNDKCNYPGYGVQYPKKVMNIYETACQKIEGATSEGTISSDINTVSNKAYDYSSKAAVYGSEGEYYFTPAFSVSYNFDLTVYEKIFKTARMLSEEYKTYPNSKEFVSNIVNKAKEIDSTVDWQTNCDELENKAYYSFAENYYLCSNSTDSNCYCEIKLPNDIEKDSNIRIQLLNGEIILSNENSDAQPTTILNKKVGFASSTLDSTNFVNLYITKKDETSYSIKATRNAATISLDYNDLKFDTPFYIKKTNDTLSFISTLNYNDAKTLANNPKNVCTIQKDTVKFCAKTKDTVPVYNEKTNSVSNINKNIKFAFMLKDITPPPIVEILASPDSFLSEKEAIIRWSQDIEDDDPTKFIIFYSKDDLSSYDYKELLEFSENSKFDNPVIKKEFDVSNIKGVSSIDLDNPEIKIPLINRKIEVQYKYAESETKAQNTFLPKIDTLYEIEDKNPNYYDYFARINFPTSEKYHVTMASLDKYGNVKMKDSEKGSINTRLIDVKDSISPATFPLQGFIFSANKIDDGKKIRITWLAKPTKNIDGSNFNAENELDHYNIYYMQNELTVDNYFTLLPNQAGKEALEYEITGVDPEKKLCYYVIPVDTKGNMQFNDKTKVLMTDKNFFDPLCIEGKQAVP